MANLPLKITQVTNSFDKAIALEKIGCCIGDHHNICLSHLDPGAHGNIKATVTITDEETEMKHTRKYTILRQLENIPSIFTQVRAKQTQQIFQMIDGQGSSHMVIGTKSVLELPAARDIPDGTELRIPFASSWENPPTFTIPRRRAWFEYYFDKNEDVQEVETCEIVAYRRCRGCKALRLNC